MHRSAGLGAMLPPEPCLANRTNKWKSRDKCNLKYSIYFHLFLLLVLALSFVPNCRAHLNDDHEDEPPRYKSRNDLTGIVGRLIGGLFSEKKANQRESKSSYLLDLSSPKESPQSQDDWETMTGGLNLPLLRNSVPRPSLVMNVPFINQKKAAPVIQQAVAPLGLNLPFLSKPSQPRYSQSFYSPPQPRVSELERYMLMQQDDDDTKSREPASIEEARAIRKRLREFAVERVQSQSGNSAEETSSEQTTSRRRSSKKKIRETAQQPSSKIISLGSGEKDGPRLQLTLPVQSVPVPSPASVVQLLKASAEDKKPLLIKPASVVNLLKASEEDKKQQLIIKPSSVVNLLKGSDEDKRQFVIKPSPGSSDEDLGQQQRYSAQRNLKPSSDEEAASKNQPLINASPVRPVVTALQNGANNIIRISFVPSNGRSAPAPMQEVRPELSEPFPPKSVNNPPASSSRGAAGAWSNAPRKKSSSEVQMISSNSNVDGLSSEMISRVRSANQSNPVNNTTALIEVMREQTRMPQQPQRLPPGVDQSVDEDVQRALVVEISPPKFVQNRFDQVQERAFDYNFNKNFDDAVAFDEYDNPYDRQQGGGGKSQPQIAIINNVKEPIDTAPVFAESAETEKKKSSNEKKAASNEKESSTKRTQTTAAVTAADDDEDEDEKKATVATTIVDVTVKATTTEPPENVSNVGAPDYEVGEEVVYSAPAAPLSRKQSPGSRGDRNDIPFATESPDDIVHQTFHSQQPSTTPDSKSEIEPPEFSLSSTKARRTQRPSVATTAAASTARATSTSTTTTTSTAQPQSIPQFTTIPIYFDLGAPGHQMVMFDPVKGIMAINGGDDTVPQQALESNFPISSNLERDKSPALPDRGDSLKSVALPLKAEKSKTLQLLASDEEYYDDDEVKNGTEPGAISGEQPQQPQQPQHQNQSHYTSHQEGQVGHEKQPSKSTAVPPTTSTLRTTAATARPQKPPPEFDDSNSSEGISKEKPEPVDDDEKEEESDEGVSAERGRKKGKRSKRSIQDNWLDMFGDGDLYPAHENPSDKHSNVFDAREASALPVRDPNAKRTLRRSKENIKFSTVVDKLRLSKKYKSCRSFMKARRIKFKALRRKTDDIFCGALFLSQALVKAGQSMRVRIAELTPIERVLTYVRCLSLLEDRYLQQEWGPLAS